MSKIGILADYKFTLTVADLKRYYNEVTEDYPESRKMIESLSEDDWQTIFETCVNDVRETITDYATAVMKEIVDGRK